MNYFHRHWQGDISIGKAIWLSGFWAWLITAPFDFFEIFDFFRANQVGPHDLIARAMMGDMGAYQPPLLMQAIDQILSMAALIWWSVGTWRACENPANNPGKPRSHWSAKLTIFAAVLAGLYGLYDFIDTALVH